MAFHDQLRAHLEAGLRAHNQGDIDGATAAYRRALALAPEDADAMHLLGVALLQLGEAGPAMDYLERAAHKQRNNPAMVGNLAQGYFANNRYAEAHAAFHKASRLDPRNVQFQLGAANSLAMQGRHGDAESALRRLVDRFPHDPLAWFNLGNASRDTGRAAQAIDSYRKAAALDPGLVDARNNLADVLHKMLRFEDAEREYRACIAMAPDYLLARCNLGSVLIDLGRFSEAATLIRGVIGLAPANAQAHTLLGAALGHQGRMLEAVACHRVAVKLSPHDAKPAQNLASALIDSGSLSEGLRWLARALELNPQLASSHLLRGYALLGQGRLGEGWEEYRCRPWPAMFREQYPDIPLAQTLPAELDGKHICVVKEQGLGDEIFFLRCVPQLHAAGARITYVATNKIRGPLTRVACIDQVLEETLPPPPADAVILAGDLPHALSDYPASALPHTDSDETALRGRVFPCRISLFWPPVPPPLALTPLAGRVAEMRARLLAIGKPPYVGLTWRGGTPPREQRLVIWALFKQIDIPPLAAALRDVPATFIALQRNPAPGEIDRFSQALGRPLHDFSAVNDDLEGMLALLAVLDDYIGVSNTNVHLRASVGKTARVLVPCPAEWRWMHAGQSSPWFPGSVVYRQSPRGDWNAALMALGRDLAGTLRTP